MYAFLVILLQLLSKNHPVASLAFEKPLALQHRGRHKTLDLWRLFLFLAFNLPAHDKLAYIIFLLQVEQLADVRSAFWTQPARLVVVREARNLLSSLFYNDQTEHSQVGSDYAATHRFAFAAAFAS